MEKKASSSLFDITMGSYDGAKSCELVGTYLLSKIKERQEIKPSTTSYWEHSTIHQQTPLRDFIWWRFIHQSHILSIRKPLMTADINTYPPFHPNLQSSQHNLQALQKIIAVEKSSGTPPPPPPYSKNVATNVGRNLLKILDEEFPKNSPLHKILI